MNAPVDSHRWLISKLLCCSCYLDRGACSFFLVKFLILCWAVCLELCIRVGKQDMAVGNGLISSFLLGFSRLTIQKNKGGGIKALYFSSLSFSSPILSTRCIYSGCPLPRSMSTLSKSGEREIESSCHVLLILNEKFLVFSTYGHSWCL